MGCEESLRVLKEIRDAIANGEYISNSTEGDWTVTRVGKHFWYGRALTFSGTAIDCDLNLSKAMKLLSVTQIFNDATSKDFSVRASNTPSGSYVQLDTDTSNVQTSRISTDINLNLAPGSRIRLVYGNFTVGKSVAIIITADEL